MSREAGGVDGGNSMARGPWKTALFERHGRTEQCGGDEVDPIYR